jgi:hypothetical protein
MNNRAKYTFSMPKAWTFFIKKINYMGVCFVIVVEYYVYNIHNAWPPLIIHFILSIILAILFFIKRHKRDIAYKIIIDYEKRLINFYTFGSKDHYAYNFSDLKEFSFGNGVVFVVGNKEIRYEGERQEIKSVVNEIIESNIRGDL